MTEAAKVMSSDEEAAIIANCNTVAEFIKHMPLDPDLALGPVVHPDTMRAALRAIANLSIPKTHRPTKAHWRLVRVIRFAQTVLDHAEA